MAPVDPTSHADPFDRLPERDVDRAVLVRLAVEPARGDLVIDQLFEAGATAIEERPVAGRVELVVGFGNRSVARDALAGLTPDDRTAAVVELPDDTWFDGWRAFARPQRVGERLVIRPDWLDPDDDPAGPDDLVILVDPGRAFGSGSHPTTRGVLAELERLVDPATATVVDVGSGSGVLAIAAALLGVPQVVAVDTDAEARDATVRNAQRNGVEVTVLATAEEVPLPRWTDDATVVVANIGAAALVGLAPVLSQAPTLVLAGFFTEGAATVAAAYPGHEVAVTRTDDGWAILTLRRDGGPRSLSLR